MSLASQLARISDMFAAVPLANRNYIVDGNFDSWVSASVPITSAFVRAAATMFIVGAGTGGAGTVAQSVAVPGADQIGMTTPITNVLQFNQTTPSTGTVVGDSTGMIVQNMESVRTLAGRSATFSVWIQGPVTIPAIRVFQNMGTGGSPSANVSADKAVNWVVGATFQRFSVRLDIPSLSGKTLGTNNDHYLQVGLIFPPGVTFNAYLAQWQLERSNPNSSSDINGNGGLPTAFEYRGQQAELARVQRQYEVANGVILQIPAVGTGISPLAFNATKRAVPAITYGSLTYTNSSNLVSSSTQPNALYAQLTASISGGYASFYWIADARL